MIPHYIGDGLRAYWQMSREDRAALMREELFDLDPMTCDYRYLPFLAMESGIRTDGIDEEEVREIIAAIHPESDAGTIAAIERPLSRIANITIKEEGGYTFSVDASLSEREITAGRMEAILRIIDAKNNTRSVMDEIILGYIVQHSQNTKTGGVGEVKTTAEQIYGYTQRVGVMQVLQASAVGEASASAIQEVS